MAARNAKKQKSQNRKLTKLLGKACSAALRNDIAQGREPYPAASMPLSQARVLDAEPKSDANYNPHGERGERRHTPPIAVALEDRLDLMKPDEAEHHNIMPSMGAVVDVRILGK